MKNIRKFDEDEQIIGTPRYKYFQRMCSEAGLFAIILMVRRTYFKTFKVI